MTATADTTTTDTITHTRHNLVPVYIRNERRPGLGQLSSAAAATAGVRPRVAATHPPTGGGYGTDRADSRRDVISGR